MLLKLALCTALGALLFALIRPASVTAFLRALGQGLGSASRAGRELWSGKRVRGSPLARYEVLAGQAIEARLLAAHPPVSDPALAGTVARVGARIAACASRREIAYRFRLVEGPAPAAYSVPGGAVIVTRPLLDLCDGDDQQLAGLLAHEIAHIDLRHAVRQLAASAAARTGLRILSLGRGALLARAIGSLEGPVREGYALHEELEADREGLRLAARAGFNPAAFAHLLRRVAASGLEAAGYFRTHPPIAERLRALGG